MNKKNLKLFNSISVVSSFYNEEKNVDKLWYQLNEVEELISIKQFIFVDNGSNDSTYIQLQKIKSLDKRILIFRNNYPSTYSKGFSTALRYSTSDYSLIIHSDLQVNIKLAIEKWINKINESQKDFDKKDFVFLTFRKNRSLFESIITYSNIKLSSFILSWNMQFDFNSQPKILPTKYLKEFICTDSYAFDLAIVNYLYQISKKINNLEFFEPIPVIVKNRKYGQSSWSKSPLKFFKMILNYLFFSIKLRFR
tara:strand:- start:303 stop:1058 length:756 start_codon:yes stop_codon:yes gene_type:complete